jgi:hypothetical protein
MWTNTPIPHWLSLPWRETRAWSAAVLELKRADAEGGGG